MTRFLLDANLSPRVAKFLSSEFQFDVKSIRRIGLEALSDREIIAMAHRERRMVITLDRDFADHFETQARPLIGIIFLRLDISQRFIPTINQILFEFFSEHAESVDLEGSLVVLTGNTVRITHSKSH